VGQSADFAVGGPASNPLSGDHFQNLQRLEFALRLNAFGHNGCVGPVREHLGGKTFGIKDRYISVDAFVAGL